MSVLTWGALGVPSWSDQLRACLFQRMVGGSSSCTPAPEGRFTGLASCRPSQAARDVVEIVVHPEGVGEGGSQVVNSG